MSGLAPYANPPPVEELAPISITAPRKLAGLWRPKRFKVMHGGRGGAKSYAVADYIIAQMHTRTVRVLCAREFQSSIADSVHRLLQDRINAMGLQQCFRITDNSIEHLISGSIAIFKGLRRNIQEIKSMEGIDICWVEEARMVSNQSWDVLIPTIRKEGSEIIITYNPEEPSDPVDVRFRQQAAQRDDIWVQEINWRDNPHFPKVLNEERQACERLDPDAYAWIWEGGYKKISDAMIFKNRYVIQEFGDPMNIIPYYGLDFGFSTDPTFGVRCFVHDGILYISHEAVGHGTEFEDMPALLRDNLPGIDQWAVRADSARPETISYLARKGFNIQGAKKWSGSVEDGISYMKGFHRIVVHPRCTEMAREFVLYRYKVDNVTGDVLPIIVDAFNHGMDATRYALDDYIHSGADLSTFAQLGA